MVMISDEVIIMVAPLVWTCVKLPLAGGGGGAPWLHPQMQVRRQLGGWTSATVSTSGCYFSGLSPLSPSLLLMLWVVWLLLWAAVAEVIKVSLQVRKLERNGWRIYIYRQLVCVCVCVRVVCVFSSVTTGLSEFGSKTGRSVFVCTLVLSRITRGHSSLLLFTTLRTISPTVALNEHAWKEWGQVTEWHPNTATEWGFMQYNMEYMKQIYKYNNSEVCLRVWCCTSPFISTASIQHTDEWYIGVAHRI